MDLYEQIRRDEGGVQLKPYRCTAGKLTIGVGRNLDDNGISASEAYLMFQNDVKNCKVDVSTRLGWADTLDDVRYAVLINMCFCMGIGRLLGFKNMLAAMRDRNWQKAHDELLDSDFAREATGQRAQRLANQLLTGEWH